jgi:general secretion pathway protein E
MYDQCEAGGVVANVHVPMTLLEDRGGFDQALGELLVQSGKLDQRGLDRALRVRGDGKESLLDLLPKLGLVAERDLAEATAQVLALPLVAARDYPAVPLFDDKLSARFLRESRILPLADDGEAVAVAMANPLDRYALDAIRLAAERAVKARVAVPAELEAAIERLYSRNRPSTTTVGAAGTGADDESVEPDVERLKDLASEAPVIRYVNQLITRASEQRASDIHIEPFEHHTRVRFRIDGVLREVEPLPGPYRQAVVSRLKIMARLNIAERRLPQDGRIKLAIRGTPIDLRVATAPTMHGESVGLRLLDRQSIPLDLAALGLGGDTLARFLSVVERPHGIVLVTGPTGSGKSTTLYASLARLNHVERKVLTVEDPVEYLLDGIDQTQVKQNIGLSFAHVLRSALRRDPDIIMVGEIRDRETAEIAVHAALTGHLVLSTLHTNSAAASVTRLLDMGVQDYLITSTVNGIAAQRLVRTLCPHCRAPYRALPELIEQLGLQRYGQERELMLHRAKGCDECHGTGFHGRTSLFETLVVSDAVRRLVLRHAESNEIHRAAVEEGMRTLYDDGMTKALAGITTIEEVLKVTRDV